MPAGEVPDPKTRIAVRDRRPSRSQTGIADPFDSPPDFLAPFLAFGVGVESALVAGGKVKDPDRVQIGIRDRISGNMPTNLPLGSRL